MNNGGLPVSLPEQSKKLYRDESSRNRREQSLLITVVDQGLPSCESYGSFLNEPFNQVADEHGDENMSDPSTTLEEQG